MTILGKVTLITGAGAAGFRRRGALLALTGGGSARLPATADGLRDAGFRARLMDAIGGAPATPAGAPLELARRAAVLMRARRGGMIVSAGSIAGKLTLPWLTMYSAFGFALSPLTAGLRVELRGEGIHAMAVCPGDAPAGFAGNAMGAPQMAAVRMQGCTGIASPFARTVVTPGAGRLLIWLARLLPAMLESRLSRASRKMEQQA
jgi:NAD(P)-dependent dehydrogenase (short-subunit alcohol dehydrogenase family)